MPRRHAICIASCLALSVIAPVAQAFVVTITGTGFLGRGQVYLRVGNGVYTGTYQSNGATGAGNGGGINVVSVTVPAAVLGNGANLPMTSNATQSISFYDGFAFCNTPSQVYIGGFNRSGSLGGGNGTLTVTAPTNLVNANNNTIPFSQISWTSSGNQSGGGSEPGPQPFPAGTFSGGAQTLATFPVNTWRESCHTFSYGNDNFVASGTYTGRVTYTLSVP